MTSRMERYYKPNNRSVRRSERNEVLYREIYDNGEYSNIEGIATIEKSNEVDITKIKNMLKNREQYQKQRGFRQAITPTPEPTPILKEHLEADRTYDIRDVLSRAKDAKREAKTDIQEYHSLDDTGYNILKRLKEKSTQKEEKYELREMIDTITKSSELNQLATRELSLDMFQELQSEHNTIIQGKDAIQSLLEEAKLEERKKETEKVEMDKSFYTSSLNFGEDDFEQIQSLKPTSKNKNIVIKIGIFIVLVTAAVGIIFLIYSLIK